MTTTPQSIEFFFDFGSPSSYLAYTQLPLIAREAGAQLVYRPMLLGGVFKATGNASPVSVAAKARWMAGDLAQWAKQYGVPFVFNPHFPINTLNLMRAAAGVQMEEAEDFDKFVSTVFTAMWVDGRNLGDATEFAEVMGKAGFNVPALLDLSLSPEVKARLVLHTEEAVARGVFGAPTMFVGEQMFFGQDRLPFVRAALHAPD